VNCWKKLLQDTDGDIDFEGLQPEDFQTVQRTAGETETMQENGQDWLERDERDPGFQHLTEEETAVVKASTIEEESDNELPYFDILCI
jgi:hypothetical protein